MSSIINGITGFFGWVGDEVKKIPEAASVVVGGIEHAVETGYGAGKSVVSDLYGGAKTVVSDVGGGALSMATSTEHLMAQTEKDMLAPVTSTIQTFSYPIMAIAGGLGLMLIWQAGKTSREALPYMPSIIDSGARAAPFFA